MNQDKIVVELRKENNDDILEFQFKNKLVINFIKSDNNDIKEIFKTILEELTKNILSDQKYNIDIASSIEGIQGLIIDVYI